MKSRVKLSVLPARLMSSSPLVCVLLLVMVNSFSSGCTVDPTTIVANPSAAKAKSYDFALAFTTASPLPVMTSDADVTPVTVSTTGPIGLLLVAPAAPPVKPILSALVVRPKVFGTAVTVNVQLAPATRVVPQPAAPNTSVLSMTTLTAVASTSPSFVTTAVSVPAVEAFKSTSPKARATGVMVRLAGFLTWPTRPSVLPATVSEANLKTEIGEKEVGLKVTPKVQALLKASVVLQALLPAGITLNSPESVALPGNVTSVFQASAAGSAIEVPAPPDLFSSSTMICAEEAPTAVTSVVAAMKGTKP